MSETCEAIGIVVDESVATLADALREPLGPQGKEAPSMDRVGCSGLPLRHQVVAALAEAVPGFRMTVAEARRAPRPAIAPLADLGTESLGTAAGQFVDGLGEAFGVDLSGGALKGLVASMLAAWVEHEGWRAIPEPR